MEWLKYLGGGCLMLVLALVLLVVAVRIAWWWFKRKLVSAFGALAAGGVPPLRIEVKSLETHAFRKPSPAKAALAALQAAGYRPAGFFEVEEPSIPLQALLHPQLGAWAVLYEHPVRGDLIVDAATRLPDGNGITATTAPDDGLDSPPWSKKIRVSAAEGAAGCAKALAGTLAGRRGVAVAGSFIADFGGAWAREMDWRHGRGGPTAEEIRRVAAAGKQAEPDESAIATVRRGWQQAWLEFVGEPLHPAVRDSGSLSAKDWEERQRLLLVPEGAWQDEALDRLLERVPEAEREAARPALAKALAGGIRGVFRAWPAPLPPAAQPRFLLTLESAHAGPVDAYLWPAAADDGADETAADADE